MPIRRDLRHLYPVDWPQVSASIRFGRAAGRCESCYRPHGKLVLCVDGGLWFDRQLGSWRNGTGRAVGKPEKPYRLRWTEVRLSACHLDHNPANCRPSNLRAWCQRCHLVNDREEHRRRAAVTVLLRRASGDLFEGPYPWRSGWEAPPGASRRAPTPRAGGKSSGKPPPLFPQAPAG